MPQNEKLFNLDEENKENDDIEENFEDAPLNINNAESQNMEDNTLILKSTQTKDSPDFRPTTKHKNK